MAGGPEEPGVRTGRGRWPCGEGVRHGQGGSPLAIVAVVTGEGGLAAGGRGQGRGRGLPARPNLPQEADLGPFPGKAIG